MEPTIEIISVEKCLEMFRNKWTYYYKNLNKESWNTFSQSILFINKCIENKKIIPIYVYYEEDVNLFFEIVSSNFSNNEEKKQFMNSVKIIKQTDILYFKKELINLSHFIKNGNSNERLVLTPICIVK